MEIQITQDLVRMKSITPDDGGCLDYISNFLSKKDFENEILTYGEVKNLWSIHRTDGPLLIFLGHVDVVPSGPEEKWTHDPFSGFDDGEFIYGRGTGDMKGGIGCFMSALERVNIAELNYSLGFLITSDEEGPSKDGTVKVVDELIKRGEKVDYCLIGEPSTIDKVGDNVRIGRRGSVNVELEIRGKQGHAAYPEKVDNPIHKISSFLEKISKKIWDKGNEHFPPTSLQITNINGGVGAHNVTPDNLLIKFNLRYSPELTFEQIKSEILELLDSDEIDYKIDFDSNAEPYYSKLGIFTDVVKESIKEQCGFDTTLSCSGGTSDGRFMNKTGAEIVELGPKFESIHKIDEKVEKIELERLTNIYHQILINLNDATKR